MAKKKEKIAQELIEALEQEEEVYYLRRRWKKIMVEALTKLLNEGKQ